MQTECIFCKKAKELLQDKNSFEGKSLNFNGFIWEKLVLINNSFYLVFEWLGCPDYKDNNINCGTSLNGENVKHKITFCPECGAKMPKNN